MSDDAVGLLKIYWKGRYFECEKGGTLKLSGAANEEVVGNFKALRSQKFEVGEVKATVLLTSDMGLDEFNPAEGGKELQVQTLGGVSYTMPGAWVQSRPENSDKGTASVTWHFNAYQKI